MSASTAVLSCNPVVLALLGSDVLPARSEPYERVSAAMAVREAVAARKTPRTVLFLVPEATSSTARYVLAGLLAANYGHERGAGRLPPDECFSFLKSQVLLITPAVAECVECLKDLCLTGATPLTEFWDIVPLARQTPKASVNKRVFVANPGWAMSRISDRRYSAVIIDATHPRTLAPLRELIIRSRAQSQLCVVVCPALPANMLAELDAPDVPDTWLWDPQAQLNALAAVTAAKQAPPAPSCHPLLVCHEDPEADRFLAEAYQEIASAARLAAGKTYAGLPLAWSILNRLRALTVPLNAYEQAAAKTWAGGLASRVRMLADVAGHGLAAWDATWPQVRQSLEAAYEGFVRRQHTAKFWALAERLQELLRNRDATYRVVAPSEVEAGLLASELQDVVDDIPDAIVNGRLEIITYADEARRVAEGLPAHTLLLGPRPSKYRYLSLYPSRPHEELLYAFEAAIERAALTRQYEAAAKLQSRARVDLLESLHLGLLTEIAGIPAPQPRAEATRADGRPVTLNKAAPVGGLLDLDLDASSDSDVRTYIGERQGPQRSGDSLEVMYSGGVVARYAVEDLGVLPRFCGHFR